LKRWLIILVLFTRLLAAPSCMRAQEAAGPAVLPPPSWDEPELLPPLFDPPRDGEPDDLLPEFVEPSFDEPSASVLSLTPMLEWLSARDWWGPEPWNAGLELGLNGHEGNKSSLSIRAGGHMKRVTPMWKLDSSLVYNKNQTNHVQTQHNAKLDARVDRILDDSPWTLFSLDNLIYDEFQNYDLQASLNVGVGYEWLKTSTIDLLTRMGAGAVREFGGVVDEWQPQALLGVDYTHQLSKLQRVAAKIDYYPEWQDFRQYRVVTDLGWQIALDKPKNVSLKLSLIDRYDSTPDGAQPNSFDYAVLFVWGL
jgi:putative salt-induced outer membrane protein YdiY